MDDDDSSRLDRYIEKSRASQRNIVFPDTVRNARSVDVFLWRGSPNPALVQRIGAWLFGLQFVVMGVIGAVAAISFVPRENGRLIFGIILAIFSTLLGIRIFRNGFRQRK